MPGLDSRFDNFAEDSTEVLNKQNGVNGSILVTGVGAQTGNWFAIQIVDDAVFTTLTGNMAGDTYAGVTFPAGLVIHGTFTALTLASGKVIAYENE